MYVDGGTMALQKIKCATRADVAREANVSETIVSDVMNNSRYVASESVCWRRPKN